MELGGEVLAVLSGYNHRMEAESAMMKSLPREEAMRRRDEFLLPVGKEVGEYLHTNVISSGAKVILEIGTSYGYSTIWLAAAAKVTKGKVITLEIDPEKAAFAKTQLEQAGLSAFVEFRVGDALTSIEQATELFDFVLLDLWKDLYLPCYERLVPKLNKGAVLVADNMLHPPNARQEMQRYQQTIRANEVFTSSPLGIGSGLEISKLI